MAYTSLTFGRPPALTEYVTPLEDLDCAEYCYRVNLDFRENVDQEPKIQDLQQIVTGLMNTSGGNIIVNPTESCHPATQQRWRLQFKRTLVRFVPEHIVEDCIQFLDVGRSTKLLVTKSPLLITHKSHLYVRGLDGTKTVSYSDDLSRVLNQKTTKANVDPFKDMRDVVYSSRIDTQHSNLICASWEDVRRDYEASLQNNNVRQTLFSFPNTPGGGCFVIGLKKEEVDDQSSEVVGHVVSEHEELQIANFLATYLASNTDGTSTLWTHENQKPIRGEDWDVRFIPVVGGPAGERRRLIVITFKQLNGGVFEHCPESYFVSEEGHVSQMPFGMWMELVSQPRTTPSHQEEEWDWANMLSMEQRMMLIPKRSTIIASQMGNQRNIAEALDYIEQQTTTKSIGIAVSQWTRSFQTDVLLSRPKNQALDVFVLDELGEIELWTLVDENARHLGANWEYLHQSGRLTKRTLLFEKKQRLCMRRCRLYQLGVGEQRIDAQMSIVSPHQTIHIPGNYFHLFAAGSEYFSPTPRMRSIIWDETSKQLSARSMEKLLSIGLDKFNFIEGPAGSGKSLLALYIAHNYRTGYIYRGGTFTKALDHWKVEYPMQIRSPDDLRQHQRVMKHLQYIIVDDVQSVRFPIETWQQLFRCVAEGKPKLILFAESDYLSFVEENHRDVKDTVDTLRSFCYQRNYHVLTKTLREIHRNTQKVVSFIKSNFASEENYPEYSEIICTRGEEGEEIQIKKLTNVLSDEYPNSLVEFTKTLTDPQKIVDNESTAYAPDEIAILVDTANPSADAKHIRRIFINMVDDQINIHDAGTFPVRGYTIDTLDNFRGLDRECCILVASDDIQQSGSLTGRSLSNPRYRAFVASRGLSRVVFVMTSEMDVAQFKTDTSPGLKKAHLTGKRLANTDVSGSQRGKRPKLGQLHEAAGHDFSQKKDRFNKFAFITIEPKGGYFKIPNMGIEMIIPKDAVDHPTTLKISIRDSFKNSPQPSYRCGLFSPRVKIEPDDVRYKKPVYLIINHNIQMALSKSDGSFNPVMLHRDRKDAEWTVITSRLMNSGDQDTEKIHGFAVCREKQAVLTSSAVIVAMMANCEECLCEFLDENSVTRRVNRMAVHVYADYQRNGGHLRVRTHVVHKTNDREQDVETKEIERYGGHFLDSQATYVDRNNQPLKIDVRVTSDGHAHPLQQSEMDNDSLRLELNGRRDIWPHQTFTFPLATNAAAAPANSVRIEATAVQCELGRVARIDETKDLDSLVQKTLRPVSTALEFQVSVGNEAGSAVGRVFGESPVYESPLAQNRDRLIVLLGDRMTQTEKEILRKYLLMEHIPNRVTAGPHDIDHIMLSTFVGTGDIPRVIDELDAIGALSEEVRRLLQALLHE